MAVSPSPCPTRPGIAPGVRLAPAIGPAPRYHVVLLDDDDHSYDYVIEMLTRLFGTSHAEAYELATEVDTFGSAVVCTTHREHAELKREQIHAYGADWRIERCAGAMSASLEPAD